MAAVMSGGGGGGGGGGLGLMSCVRESSPTDIPDAEEVHHHETKKRRFHPLRGLRRMFRRKSRPPDASAAAATADVIRSEEDARCLDARSRSAGQLQADDAQSHSRNSVNLQSGLSVSHDSIFSPEQRSAGSQSESELESSSSLSMQRLLANTQSGIKAELLDAVRRRRMREEQTSEEEEDLGLPRSPFSASSTTTDILIEKVLKENTNKSSHSTCSDGSLLSMGSSEMDEDSFGPGSRHSSKLSLQEKKSLVSSDVSPSHATTAKTALDFGGGSGSAPLSHSAAKHKMAVRPKRTYGAPRRSRMRQLAAAASQLPVTPELNEDGSARSASPEQEIKNRKEGGEKMEAGWEGGVGVGRGEGGEEGRGGGGAATGVGVGGGGVGVGREEGRGGGAATGVGVGGEGDATSDAIDADCMMTSSAAQLTSVQLKSASLPLGMTAPGLSGWSDPACKLSRSKSSAADRKQPLDAASVVESEEELPKKEDTSFFGRLLSRRSGKKKKNSTEEQPAALELPQKRMDDKGRYVQEPPKLTRNHPASRQRVEPISIPSEPSVTRMHVSYSAPTSSTIPEPSEDHHKHFFKPTNRVIPDDIDLELQRRSLVKKSHSFRLTTSDAEAPKSLDPTILISTKSSSSVILSSSPPSDTVEPNNKSSDDGALNRNLIDDITSDVSPISETKSESCSSVYIKSVLLPCCPDDDNVIESVTVENEITKHSPTKAWDDEITVNNESLSAPLSHQITIPVNASVVSVVDADKAVENSEGDCLDEVEMDIADLSDEIDSSVPTSPVKPEPRQRTPDDLTFFPVPAPRISKRESTTPVEVPEFMKVQLNRFDGRKLSNVILSTSPNTIFKQDHVLQPATSCKAEDVVSQVTTKTDECVTDNVIDTKDLEKPVNDKNVNLDSSLVSTKVVEDFQDESESNEEKISINLEEFGNKNVEELEVEVSVSPSKCSSIDNAPKVVELKQWSSNTAQVVTGIPPRPVPNPRYSIVSITAASKGSEASNQSSELPKNQTAGQIVRKKSIVKDAQNDVVLEQNHRKADLDRDLVNEKDSSESKPIIPRKKSFNTDVLDSVGGVSQLKQTPRLFTKQNNRAVENQWNRKSSFEEFNDRIVGEQNGKNRSKDDEPVRERNSIGSCDALESADVVMRRKPLSREVTRQNDDEPELLKVFARRSLKVKDCDLPSDLEIAPEPSTKSRDSDKENECGDSPPEERKKIKEAFVDTKDTPKPSSVAKTDRSVAKTQKSILSAADADTSDVLLKENNQTSYEKRQRSRTFPDNQKILEPPKRPVAQRVLQDVFKEKEVEVISLEGSKNSAEVNENNNNLENDVPLFKRIQQRKEEWEKRAQLAANKRHHP